MYDSPKPNSKRGVIFAYTNIRIKTYVSVYQRKVTYNIKMPVIDEKALIIRDRHDAVPTCDELSWVVADALCNCVWQFPTTTSLDRTVNQIENFFYLGLYAPYNTSATPFPVDDH